MKERVEEVRLLKRAIGLVCKDCLLVSGTVRSVKECMFTCISRGTSLEIGLFVDFSIVANQKQTQYRYVRLCYRVCDKTRISNLCHNLSSMTVSFISPVITMPSPGTLWSSCASQYDCSYQASIFCSSFLGHCVQGGAVLEPFKLRSIERLVQCALPWFTVLRMHDHSDWLAHLKLRA